MVTSTGQVSVEKRGRPKTVDDRMSLAQDLIREHIGKFPRIPSHYCRRDTTKEYLNSDLTVVKMHELYKTWLVDRCADEVFSVEELQLSYKTYWNIFDTEFNIAFHKPKKDLCSICEVGRNDPDSLSDDGRARFEQHLKAKDAVRKCKQDLKDHLASYQVFACFDLQQVMYCPLSDVGEVFYKRLLSCYNLTVYDVGTKTGYCYFWPEEQGGRGSNEIGTCIRLFLQQAADEGKREAFLFCDSTSSQNRNSNIVAMVAELVWFSGSNLDFVRITYFEKGHGQCEGDTSN